MITQINKVRAQHSLPPLRSAGKLNRSSARFSSWLQRNDYFGHTGRVRASGFRRMGEALGMHFGRSLGIRSTVRSWLRSPSHRRLVLTRSMNRVGAGAAKGSFRGHRATIWVLHLGRR